MSLRRFVQLLRKPMGEIEARVFYMHLCVFLVVLAVLVDYKLLPSQMPQEVVFETRAWISPRYSAQRGEIFKVWTEYNEPATVKFHLPTGIEQVDETAGETRTVGYFKAYIAAPHAVIRVEISRTVETTHYHDVGVMVE